MKNIYFVETSFSFDNDVYFPYATGTIAAYLKKMGCFNKNFNLAGFFYRREPTDSIIRKLEKPYVVGFSCSIWNFRFNLKLAEKIKKLYPECIIVFGGHNISYGENLLKTYDFIDILVYGEGEYVFYDLLENLQNNTLIKTNSVSFKKNNIFYTTPYAAIKSLDELPSPYLSGIFDDILKKESPSSMLCVFETNRGCPYSCSFCGWCSENKVRLFPIEKVLGEIDWISKNKIEYCYCADSNFGMFKRDVDIVRAASEAKRINGYPKAFKIYFAKESNDTVFEIASILNKAGMDKGVAISYQTLSKNSLRSINRKNLTLEHFSELSKRYNASGIPVYSELILGLPDETRKSFCEGICKLLEYGQHNSLSIYYLEMLPNSEMSKKSYIAKHKLNAESIAFNHTHSQKKHEEVEEFSHIVQSTATLSKDDWVYCGLFSVCVQSFHSLGFLQYIAIYLYTEKKTSYFDFYSSLLEFILNGQPSVLKDLFLSFKRKLNSSLSGDWNFVDTDFGDNTWTFEEGAYLTFLKNIDSVWTELDKFLIKYFDDTEFYNQLKNYQKAVLRQCSTGEHQLICDYDFFEYFSDVIQNRNSELKKVKVKYTFSADKYYSDWKEFAKEIVWYGRKRSDTMFSNRKNGNTSIKKEYLL